MMISTIDFETEIQALTLRDAREWEYFSQDGAEAGERFLAGTLGLTKSHPQYKYLMTRAESMLKSKITRAEKAA